MFHALYHKMLFVDNLINESNPERSIRDIFNDACYITAYAINEQRPALFIKNFWNYARGGNIKGYGESRIIEPSGKVRGDIVMITVWLLLRKVLEKSPGTQDFYNIIESKLRMSAADLFEDFKKACPEELNQDLFTFELPSFSNPGLQFYPLDEITDNFDLGKIEDIVRHFGKTYSRRMAIVKAIELQISENDKTKTPELMKYLRRLQFGKSIDALDIYDGIDNLPDSKPEKPSEPKRESPKAKVRNNDDDKPKTEKKELTSANEPLRSDVECQKDQPQLDILKEIIKATKALFRHDITKADIVRQVLLKAKCDNAAEELDKWIEGKQNPRPSVNVGNMSVNTLSATQVNDIHGNDTVNLDK